MMRRTASYHEPQPSIKHGECLQQGLRCVFRRRPAWTMGGLCTTAVKWRVHDISRRTFPVDRKKTPRLAGDESGGSSGARPPNRRATALVPPVAALITSTPTCRRRADAGLGAEPRAFQPRSRELLQATCQRAKGPLRQGIAWSEEDRDVLVLCRCGYSERRPVRCGLCAKAGCSCIRARCNTHDTGCIG